jgi:hypothetical protein
MVAYVPCSAVPCDGDDDADAHTRPGPVATASARTARRSRRQFEADLSAPVLAAGNRLPNVRQISERVAMGRALWRELVIGFAGSSASCASASPSSRRSTSWPTGAR